MALYSEQELEQAALEWFQELGYETQYGPELSPEGDYPERTDYSQVVLEERLRETLSRINFHLPPEAIEEAVRKITVPQSPNLLVNNQAFHQMMTDGIDVQVKQEDGGYKT
jgi:type I restriction enzyme R subunit